MGHSTLQTAASLFAQRPADTPSTAQRTTDYDRVRCRTGQWHCTDSPLNPRREHNRAACAEQACYGPSGITVRAKDPTTLTHARVASP